MSMAGSRGAGEPAHRLQVPGSGPAPDIIEHAPRRIRPAWLRGPVLAVAVVVIVAVVAVIVAGSRPPAPSARDQHWQRDVAVLARRLPQVHAEGLTHVTPAAWHAAAARLEAQVPRLSNGQVLVGLARLVALLHDDETQLMLPDSPVYLFNAQWVGSGLYLTAVPSADRGLLGARLLAVDGHPMAEVESRLRAVIDFQDPGTARAREIGLDQVSLESPGYLNNANLLAWLGLASSPRGATFTLRLAGGGLRRVWLAAHGRDNGPVPPVAAIPAPLYLQRRDEPFWMRVLPRQHAVYLKYSQCLPNDGFQRLAARAMAVLDAHPGYRLIVDLRNNGGGDSTPFQSLLASIARDRALNRRGRVLGLINGLTASSATLDAGLLDHVTRGLLIGQQVSDPVDEFGNDNGLLRLPYNDVLIQYPTATVNSPRTPQGIPDLPVAPTVHDLLTGADPVLAAALAYGREDARPAR
jgi:hypothetical protein